MGEAEAAAGRVRTRWLIVLGQNEHSPSVAVGKTDLKISGGLLGAQKVAQASVYLN